MLTSLSSFAQDSAGKITSYTEQKEIRCVFDGDLRDTNPLGANTLVYSMMENTLTYTTNEYRNDDTTFKDVDLEILSDGDKLRIKYSKTKSINLLYVGKDGDGYDYATSEAVGSEFRGFACTTAWELI